jgi:hypothetical protein
MVDKLEPTGLLKKCPRCRAVGRVFINETLSDAAGSLKFNVSWDNSVDTNVNASDLFEVDFGCGDDD